MHLRVVGSSPAWPNPGGACSGYLVDERLLLDCGPGVLAKLREREAWPTVDTIAITHLHLDHWGDLIPWVWGALYGPGSDQPRPRLLLPLGTRAVLRPLLEQLGTRLMLESVFDVEEYEAGQELEIGDLRLTPLPVVHYALQAYGFRVVGSRTLAYSGDTAPCDPLLAIARDADLFVCEATLSDPNEGDRRGHMTPEEARDAQQQAGAERLLLTHRPRERPLPDGFELAHDGLELDF